MGSCSVFSLHSFQGWKKMMGASNKTWIWSTNKELVAAVIVLFYFMPEVLLCWVTPLLTTWNKQRIWLGLSGIYITITMVLPAWRCVCNWQHACLESMISKSHFSDVGSQLFIIEDIQTVSWWDDEMDLEEEEEEATVCLWTPSNVTPTHSGTLRSHTKDGPPKAHLSRTQRNANTN